MGLMIPGTSHAIYMKKLVFSMLKSMYFIENFKINRIISAKFVK
jgi:hypothetical protein